MTTLWPTLVRKKAAGIPHTTYIFPEVDGSMYNTAAVYAEAWDTSGDTNSDYSSGAVSTGEGYVDFTARDTFVPAAPSPSNPTGNIRTAMSTSTWAVGNGGVNGTVAISYVNIGGTADILDGLAYYDPVNGGTHPHKIFWLREVAPTDYNYSDTGHIWYTDDDNGDDEGSKVWLEPTAYADNGTARYAAVTTQINWIRQEVEYHNNSYGWPTVWADTGASARSSDKKWANAMIADSDASAADINRAFFTFNMSPFDDGETRAITSAEFECWSYHDAETGDSSTDAIIQISQHTEAEGALTGAVGFTPAGPDASSNFTWEGGSDTLHEISLNSAGIGHLEDVIGVGDGKARFCMREYTHDYLNDEPDDFYGNGMYFVDQEPSGEGVLLAPRIEINYLKMPDWTDRTSPEYWDIQGGTWSGSVWYSTNEGFGEEVWFEIDSAVFEDWRPAAARVIFAGEETLSMFMFDDEGYIFDEVVSSGEILTIPWRGDGYTYDMLLFGVYAGEGGPFTVTSIEFLER